MAYFVKKSPKNGRICLQIINGVYDPKTKNAKQTVFKKLGYLDDLQKEFVDPIQHYKAWCTTQNELNKQRDLDPIPEKTAHLNLGYFPF